MTYFCKNHFWLLYGEDCRETKKKAKRPVRKLQIIQVSDEGGLNKHQSLVKNANMDIF